MGKSTCPMTCFGSPKEHKNPRGKSKKVAVGQVSVTLASLTGQIETHKKFRSLQAI